MRIFKAITAYISMALLILFMDLSQLIPNVNINIFLVFLIIVPLAYLPWHWYRQGGKGQRLNHLAECFLIIASISLSGRFYLELHGVKQWRYPFAQVSPSFSPILANETLPDVLSSLMSQTVGASSTQILMTAHTALVVMKFKYLFQANNYSPSWCKNLKQKDCAFKIYKELIESKTTNITTIVLGIAIGTLEITKYKNEMVKGLSKEPKIKVLAETILDLSKWSYAGVKRSDELITNKYSRSPSSLNIAEETIKRLVQLDKKGELKNIASIGLLRAYDEPQLNIYTGYIVDSYHDYEIFLLDNTNKAIIYKFLNLAVNKNLKMLTNLRDKVSPTQQAEVDNYLTLFSKYQ